MMDTMADRMAGAIGGMLKAQAESLLSSWVGIALVAIAFGLFVFPVARAIYRTSKWAAAGTGLLLVAVVIYRPSLPPAPAPLLAAQPVTQTAVPASAPAPAASILPGIVPQKPNEPWFPAFHSTVNQVFDSLTPKQEHFEIPPPGALPVPVVPGERVAGQTSCGYCQNTYPSGYPVEVFKGKCPSCGEVATVTMRDIHETWTCPACKQSTLAMNAKSEFLAKENASDSPLDPNGVICERCRDYEVVNVHKDVRQYNCKKCGLANDLEAAHLRGLGLDKPSGTPSALQIR